jgi:sec-independent protein translocase protein TatC
MAAARGELCERRHDVSARPAASHFAGRCAGVTLLLRPAFGLRAQLHNSGHSHFHSAVPAQNEIFSNRGRHVIRFTWHIAGERHPVDGPLRMFDNSDPHLNISSNIRVKGCSIERRSLSEIPTIFPAECAYNPPMAAALSSVRSSPPQDDDDAGGRMSFLEHLEDLRKRIIHSCIALAAGMAVALFFMENLASFVLAPTRRILPPGTDLISSRPTETFAFSFDIAMMAGLILAAPVIMYQVWLFVVPALYANEKKLVIPFVALTAIGSVAGAAFSHWILFPGMMRFFATFTLAGITFQPRVEYVFELYVRSLIGMVIVFQIPTLAFFLARIHVVTPRS